LINAPFAPEVAYASASHRRV